MVAKVLIIGCGDLGTQIALNLHSQNFEVLGLRISNKPLPANIVTIQADVTQPETLDKLSDLQPNYLIYCVAGSAKTSAEVDDNYRLHYVDGLRHVLATQQNNQHLKHVFFVSSTRVYGQKTEEIIDDTTNAIANDAGGERLLEAENLLNNLLCGSTVLRLSGIYGPGRTRMLKLAEQPSLWPAQNSWSNRIHRDDAAAFIVHLINLLQQQKPIAACYIVTDSQPSTQYETLIWIANKILVLFDEEIPSVAGGKRLANKRLIESGFSLKYPNYQVGYEQLLLNHRSL